jgi:hemerythrin-like domain-containing protein
LINELKRNLEQANNYMNSYADQHHRKEQYLLGDWVYLKLQSYRKESLSHKALYKLSFRHHEPYHITQKIGEVACKLELRE